MKHIKFFSILFLLTIFAVSAYSFPGMCGKGIGAMKGGPMKGGMFLQKFNKELNLTDDQEKKLEDLQYANEKKAIDLEAAAKKAELELRRVTESDNIDVDKAEKLIDELAAAKTSLMKLRMLGHIRMLSVLTPEQRDEIKKLHKKSGWKRGKGAKGKKAGKNAKGGRGQRQRMGDSPYDQ